MEIEYAKLIDTPKFTHKANDSWKYIDENRDKLIEAYHLFHEKYRGAIKAFETKKCEYCGGIIRYVSRFDFWGCANYTTLGGHSKFYGKNPDSNFIRVRVPSWWMGDIINHVGFKDKIHWKEFFQFLQDEGLEDLRWRYHRSSSIKNFNGLIIGKERSLVQEKKSLDFLKQTFQKVLYQQCIGYKVKGEKPTFCIPDFIAADTSTVRVIDAKLDYPDNRQMDLYVGLLSYIVKNKGDNRNVVGAFIMYDDGSTFYTNKYPIIRISES